MTLSWDIKVSTHPKWRLALWAGFEKINQLSLTQLHALKAHDWSLPPRDHFATDDAFDESHFAPDQDSQDSDTNDEGGSAKIFERVRATFLLFAHVRALSFSCSHSEPSRVSYDTRRFWCQI